MENFNAPLKITLNFTELINSESKKYFKNLDIELHDSYFTNKGEFHIKFPVDDKVVINGLHYYNLFIGKIIVIHLSNKKGTSIRDKKIKEMCSFNFTKDELTTITGDFNIKKSERIHIFIYNDNTKYPIGLFSNLEKINEELSLLPKENGGGGVIIEGP